MLQTTDGAPIIHFKILLILSDAAPVVFTPGTKKGTVTL